MPQQRFPGPYNQLGVPTTATGSDSVRYNLADNPAGNNKLVSGYPVRGENKPLTVSETATRAGRTVSGKTYNEMAFGTNTDGTVKTQNPYSNNYAKFDSRYPSIWRKPKGVNYVRGLDEWERAALDAALGIPWTPSVSGPGSTSPAPPPAVGPTSQPAAAPQPAPSPEPEPSPAPDSTLSIYGPIIVPFSTTYGGASRRASRRATGGVQSIDQNLDIYIVASSVGAANRYFYVDPDNNVNELIVNPYDKLQLNDLKSETLTGDYDERISDAILITNSNNPEVYNAIMNFINNEGKAPEEGPSNGEDGPPPSEDGPPPSEDGPPPSEEEVPPPSEAPPSEEEVPPPSEAPPSEAPPSDVPPITIYGGYDNTFVSLTDSSDSFDSFIYVVTSPGNVNRYFIIDRSENTVELLNEDTDGHLLYNNEYVSSQSKNDLDNLVTENPKVFTETDDSIGYNRIYIAATQGQGGGRGRKQKNKSRRFRKHFRKTRRQRK